MMNENIYLFLGLYTNTAPDALQSGEGGQQKLGPRPMLVEF